MKIEAYGYEHEPGVSLQVIPETDVETKLLTSIWKHGHLEVVHFGFSIRCKPSAKKEVSNETG